RQGCRQIAVGSAFAFVYWIPVISLWLPSLKVCGAGSARKRGHPLAAAPVVECHPLQCGSLQNRHVTTIFVGNRQKGLRQPTARFVNVDHIVTEVAGDFGPGGIEGLSDRLQGLWAERCPIDEMPSLCLSLSAHSYYPASFEMVWW